MARAIWLVVTCGIAARAAASPGADPTAGRAVFTGATLPGATSIALDPAALPLGATNEISISMTGVFDQYAIDRLAIDPNTGALSPAGSVRDTELGFPSGALSAIFHAADQRVAIGVELRLPPPDAYPGPKDPLRYHTLGGRRRDFVGTAGVGVKAAPFLLLGASLTYDRPTLQLAFARDTALANGRGPGGITSDCGGAPCGLENPLATERYDISVQPSSALSTDNLILNVGLLVQLRDAWLAIAYHFPPGFALQTTLAGTMTVTRAPRDGGGVVQGGATVYVSLPGVLDGELRARLVQNLELHVGGRWIPRYGREQWYDVRGYGADFAAANIPEWQLRPLGYKNQGALWAGVEQIETSRQHLSDRLRFGGRVGFETAALDANRTSPMAVAPASLTLDAGAQLRPSRTSPLIFDASYGLQFFPPVNVTNSAFDPRDRLACIDSGFDYATAACQATRNGYAIDTAAGNYSRIEHAFRFAIRYQW